MLIMSASVDPVISGPVPAANGPSSACSYTISARCRLSTQPVQLSKAGCIPMHRCDQIGRKTDLARPKPIAKMLPELSMYRAPSRTRTCDLLLRRQNQLSESVQIGIRIWPSDLR